MDPEKLRDLLQSVRQGTVDIETAMEKLKTLPYEDLGDFARLDLHRGLRNAMPEVVFCESKTSEQATAILQRPISRLLTLTRAPLPTPPEDTPYAMVVCGGTSDLPVAEEAAQVLEFLGHRVERAVDVGVAGLHRLLSELPRLTRANVVIAVAGMEGALTSVVAGLVAAPVIGVPTSVGYGVNFQGIDNGYGAAVFAHLILRQISLSNIQREE